MKSIFNPYILTVLMLTVSNCFMTFAWYGHLKTLANKPFYIAVLISWGIAFFEYCVMVPANRIGSQVFSLSQLKIIQEVITLTIFVLFSIYYMHQPFKTDYIWAGLCLLGAVYFMFRN